MVDHIVDMFKNVMGIFFLNCFVIPGGEREFNSSGFSGSWDLEALCGLMI